MSYNTVKLVMDWELEVRPRLAVWEQSRAGQLIPASLFQQASLAYL